jgi:hypothetical protein
VSTPASPFWATSLSGGTRDTALLGLDLLTDEAVGEVVVHETAGLHGRVDGRRAHETESRLFQLPGEGPGVLGLRLDVGPGTRRSPQSRTVGPHEVDEAEAGVTKRQHRARVRDRGLDLEPVPHDRRVREETVDVRGAKSGHAFRVEIREGTAEPLALPQDRQPRQPRLEAFEAELLEQSALVEDRPAPLAVVVVAVDLDVVAEASLDGGQDGASVTCEV